MKKLKHSLVAVFGLLVVTAVIGLIIQPTTRAQIAEKIKTGVTSVLIVNSPSEPIPVAGTVNVANSPLSVQNVNDPIREPYQAVRQTTLGNTGNTRNNFEVPAGKRLVIEQISAIVETSPATCNALFLNVRVTDVQSFYFPIEVVSSSTFNLYAAADKTSFWADQDVSFDARTNGACDYQQVTLNVSGYLVDRP
jgi:hypothetical protein